MLLMLINQQRGSAAIAAIITMIVLGLLGTAFVTLSTTELRIATAHRDGVAAQYLAEAGAMWARIQLHGDVDQSKMFYNATNSASGKTYPAVTKNTGTATQGTYTVTVSQDSVGHAGSSDWRKIVSVGNVNGAKRTVSLVINLKSNPITGITNEYSPIFANSLFSGSTMTLNNASNIIGNIHSNGNIVKTAGNNTNVTGNIKAVGTVSGVTLTNTTSYKIYDKNTFPPDTPIKLPVPDLDTNYKDFYKNSTKTIIVDSVVLNKITNSSKTTPFDMASKIYFVDSNLTLPTGSVLTGMGVFYVTGTVSIDTGVTMGKVLIIAAGKKDTSNKHINGTH